MKPQPNKQHIRPAIKPISETRKPIRQLGTLKGKVWISPDAFTEETNRKLWDDFYKAMEK